MNGFLFHFSLDHSVIAYARIIKNNFHKLVRTIRYNNIKYSLDRRGNSCWRLDIPKKIITRCNKMSIKTMYFFIRPIRADFQALLRKAMFKPFQIIRRFQFRLKSYRMLLSDYSFSGSQLFKDPLLSAY